jgi:hypothetical protein
MIKSNLASIPTNINAFARQKLYRNRVDRLNIADVTIDNDGHISHRPIARLSCFADPVEYYFGLSDTPSVYQGEEQPRGCAGCPSRPACGKFAFHRVEDDAELTAKRDAWEHETRQLTGAERYTHATFIDFAASCRQRQWTSTNGDELAAKRAADAKRKRQARDKQRQKDKRGKTVTPSMLAALHTEHEQRLAALTEATRAPGAGTWLRNLNDRSIALTCDVWLTLAVMERRYGGEVKGSEVMRAMVATGRDYGLSEQSLRVRVNEAIRRIARLESEPSNAPVWGDISGLGNAIPPRSPGHILNGVNHLILEDDRF